MTYTKQSNEHLMRFTNIGLIIICILLGLGIYLFPNISDDLNYALSYKDYLIGGKPFDIQMIVSNIKSHYLYDNARLCNVIAILLAPLPRLIGAIISTLSIAYLFFIGAKYAKIQHQPLPLSFWAAFITFCFPWIDQMYILDFQINYLWSSALALFTTIAFIKQRNHSTATLAVLSLITGLWHEAFSFPLLIAIIAVSTLNKRLRTTKTYTMALSLSIGFAYLTTAPCFQFTPIPQYGSRMIMVYPYAVPFIAAAICALRRRKKLSTRALMLLLPALTATALMIYGEKGSRVGSLGIVYSGLYLASIMPSTKRNHLIASTIFALTALHLIAVDMQAYKANKSTAYVLKQYATHPNSTIYSDMVLRENAPWFCLQKPYYGWFAHNSTLTVFENFYGDGSHQMLVVPQKLEHFTPSNATKISGDTNAYFFDGLIVLQQHSDKRLAMQYNVNHGRGTRYCHFMAVPFKSLKDGKTYCWLYPENTFLDQVLHPQPISLTKISS
jgi:hypothetical protein